MKPFYVRLLTFAAAVCAGCSSSPLSRIDQDRAKYESWPIEVREAVLAGEARKGMTQEQVEMAMGRPTQVIPRSADEEVWIYRKSSGGSNLLGGSGIAVGTGGGGVMIGGGSGRRGVTPEEYEIVFAKGVVVRSTSP
ncbi:MAG: hypothetical protein Q7S40_30230 [Opitutaceae bacterium]|nr:hypothetical protein [Opitutaceae bacterium]